MAFQLRPYQQELIEKCIIALKGGHRKPLLVLPTGGGKTAIASELVKRSFNKGKSSIFICHRQEILRQTFNTYIKNGITPSVIQGGFRPDYNNPMQIASVNTLVRRLDKIRKPDLIFVDECFPAGTKIRTINGDKKIENLRIGDSVLSFNEEKKSFEYKNVTELFRKIMPHYMMSLTIRGHHTIVCTLNHPFYTKRGWVEAGELTTKDEVLYERSKINLYSLWKRICGNRKLENSKIQPNWSSLLFERMFKRILSKIIIRNNGKNKSQVCFTKNERKESDEATRDTPKGFGYSESHTPQTKNSWWKWSGTTGSRKEVAGNIITTRICQSMCNKYWALPRWFGLSNKLQTRCRKSSSKNRRGSGRWLSQIFGKKNTRPKERRTFNWTRVESIKIQQSKYIRESERYFVYNLGVDKNHTYIANGVVVHNCHHTPSSTWAKVAETYPDAVFVGLSATPCRLDGKPLNKFFDAMIEVINTKELIEQGYLSKYLYYAPSTISTSELKVASNGDYSKDSLENASFATSIIGDNIAQYQKLANGKRNVVFAINRRHAASITERYNAAGINAKFLDGETPTRERKETIKQFESGEVKVLVNVDLFGEGFDLPAIECVSLLRPTASTSLYLQQVGRGLRTCEGKEYAVILDHVNNYQRHGMPDDIREWSLDGGLTKHKRGSSSNIAIRRCPRCFFAHKPALKCPNCGYIYEADGKEIKEIAGELVLLGSEEARQQEKKEVIIANTLDELVRIEKDRKYKFGWAERQWILKTGENLWRTFSGLEKIAAARGYNKSWAWVHWKKTRG